MSADIIDLDGPHGFEHLCGWMGADDKQKALAAAVPTLAQAAPSLASDPDKSILLYRVWKAVFSGDPDYPGQAIGDCTSFGNGHAHDLLQTIEAYLGDLPVDSVHRTATEALYGMGREISGGLGLADGSYGAAMAKAMVQWGLISYAKLGELGYDTTYSGQRAKSWGWHGAPQKVKDAAAACKLGAAALVDSNEAGIAALQAGHPFAICTGMGFTMTRDQDGFVRRKGHWGHCMCCAGYRSKKETGRDGFLILQSWGPQTPDGPLALDQPSFSFWIEPQDMATILSEGDSFAISGSPGFGAKSLPAELTAH
jgi:hypothetical protein